MKNKGVGRMIEDIMELLTTISDNCTANWTRIDDYVLYSKNGFIHIDGLNLSHTVMFKIRAKQSDIGLNFQYPCIYKKEDILSGKWKVNRMDFNNISDKTYWDLLKFDYVFDINYDSTNFNDFERLLKKDIDEILVKNNNSQGVYSSELLQSAIIPNVEDIRLKIIYQDAPLRLHYNYSFFNVYCLIAPRLVDINPDIWELVV